MQSETGIPVYVLRALRIPVAAAWPALKHYDYGVAKVRCGIGT